MSTFQSKAETESLDIMLWPLEPALLIARAFADLAGEFLVGQFQLSRPLPYPVFEPVAGFAQLEDLVPDEPCRRSQERRPAR